MGGVSEGRSGTALKDKEGGTRDQNRQNLVTNRRGYGDPKEMLSSKVNGVEGFRRGKGRDSANDTEWKTKAMRRGAPLVRLRHRTTVRFSGKCSLKIKIK